MAKKDVGSFFVTVHQDKSLQGALNYALAKSAPGLVVEIAKDKGFQFSESDLAAALASASGGLSDSELDGVVGGAAFSLSSPFRLSNSALTANFWANVTRLDSPDGGFGLTIPGPSFVQVASADARHASEVSGKENGESTASAVDVYQDLVAE